VKRLSTTHKLSLRFSWDNLLFVSLAIEAYRMKTTCLCLTKCGVLYLSAALVTGCGERAAPDRQTSTPTARRQESASPIANETRPFTAPFAERSIAGRIIRFYTLESLSGFDELKGVEITPDVNSSWAEKNGLPIPTDKTLASMIVTSSPIPPDSPQLEAWHYAPWFNASFVSQDLKWTLAMYLGGLGFLTNESGQTAAFLWRQGDSSREQSPTPEPTAGPVQNGDFSSPAR
jgi:hypothetical protein